MTQQTEAQNLADELGRRFPKSGKQAAAELRRLDEVEKAYNLLLERTYAQPVDIAALVEGMEVSIDVSTGDHDSGNRLFGTVTLVQENQGSKHGLILLVQDPEPNFNIAPPASPVQFKCTVVDDQHPAGVPLSQWGTPPAAQRQWVGLTAKQIASIPLNEYTVQTAERLLKENNT